MRPGWVQTTLGEIVSFKGGGTPSTENSSYWNGDIPWVSPKDMKASEVGDSIDKITPEAIENSAASLIPKDAILIVVRSGILARTIPVAITARPLAVNQDIKALCPNKDVDPRFLHYFMQASEANILKLVTRGATVHRLSTDSLRALQLPIPPLSEQQRIVAILDEAFAGLATATANAEKNLKNARELFESYLNSAFENNSKWGTRPLEELCEDDRVITYGVIKLGKEVSNGVPCLRTSNVRWLRIDTDSIKKISPALSSEFRRTILRGGEVLVNVRGTLGGVAIATQDMKGWNVSREVAVVPVDASRIEPAYLAYFIATRRSQGWLTDVQKGLAYVGINIADLRTLPVSFPSKEMQVRMIKQFQKLSAESRRLEAIYEKRHSQVDELRQAVLKAAFSGELTSPPSQAIKEAAE